MQTKDALPEFMIIAELSANHCQSQSNAFRLIDAAARAGANAVKVQTYTPDTLTFPSKAACFRIEDQPLWKGQYLWDLYKKAYTPWDWQPALRDHARAAGLRFIASVFDPSSVAFWEKEGLCAYKIASAEMIDIPLLECVAATGRPILLSTGMATLAEIEEAAQCIESIQTSPDLTLLKCSSAYPAPVEEMNLLGLKTLAQQFLVKTGLSDHSLCTEAAVVAVALGATVFEKHLKLESSAETPDAAFSLDPSSFEAWVNAIRTAQKCLGSSELKPTPSEKATLLFRKSLFAVKDIRAGESLNEKNIRSIRPSNGMHPRHYRTILGKSARVPIKAGTPLSEDLIITD